MPFSFQNYTRRQFLGWTSALTAAAVLPSTLLAELSTKNAPLVGDGPQIPTRDTQLKFNPDGTARAFAGNTVICHLPIQCAMRDTMAAFHRDLLQAPYRPKLGLTSVDSYHMTVFSGANDLDRSMHGWPSYVPKDASIETCNRMVAEKMAQLDLRCQLPLRVKIDQPYTLRYPLACTLRLVPDGEGETAKLRSVRDQLALAYGFRSSDHDRYEFHMTMSYQLASFTEEEQSAYRKLLASHLAKIVASTPILELGEPEYCTFPDMHRFRVEKLLKCS